MCDQIVGMSGEGGSENMACLGDMDGGARDEPSSSRWPKDEPMNAVQIVSIELGVRSIWGYSGKRDETSLRRNIKKMKIKSAKQ